MTAILITFVLVTPYLIAIAVWLHSASCGEAGGL